MHLMGGNGPLTAQNMSVLGMLPMHATSSNILFLRATKLSLGNLVCKFACFGLLKQSLSSQIQCSIQQHFTRFDTQKKQREVKTRSVQYNSSVKLTIGAAFILNLATIVGNELCGDGVSAKVNATRYAMDLIKLKKIIHRMYRGFNAQDRPKLLTPGGFFNMPWFAEMLQVSGPDVVNVVTHHIYNLGPGTSSEFMFSKFSFTIFPRIELKYLKLLHFKKTRKYLSA